MKKPLRDGLVISLIAGLILLIVEHTVVIPFKKGTFWLSKERMVELWTGTEPAPRRPTGRPRTEVADPLDEPRPHATSNAAKPTENSRPNAPETQVRPRLPTVEPAESLSELLGGLPSGQPKLPTKATRQLRGHKWQINALAFSPDGKLLASGSNDFTIRIWSPQRDMALASLVGHQGSVTALAFSPDGRSLASGADRKDPSLVIWDLETRQERLRLAGHSHEITSLAFSEDGRMLASGSYDGTVRLWNTSSGAPLCVQRLGNRVKAVAFSLSGHRFASAQDDSISLWQARQCRILRTLKAGGTVQSAAFSPNGQLLVSSSSAPVRSEGDLIQFWNSRTAGLVKTLQVARDSAQTVTFSPDGRRIAIGGWKLVHFWDPVTDRKLHTIRGQEIGWVSALAFSPNGGFLASAGSDRTVRVWQG